MQFLDGIGGFNSWQWREIFNAGDRGKLIAARHWLHRRCRIFASSGKAAVGQRKGQPCRETCSVGGAGECERAGKHGGD
jgi:hypothetical protein